MDIPFIGGPKKSDAPAGAPAPSDAAVPVSEVLARHPPAETAAPRARRTRSDKGVPRGAQAGAPTSEQAAVEPGLSTVAREQVLAGIKALVTTVDARVTLSIRRLAVKVTNDEAFAQGMADEVKMSELESESIITLSTVVIEKYGVLGTYAPEILLGLTLLGYGYRVKQATSELKTLAKVQATSHGVSSPSKEAAGHRP